MEEDINDLDYEWKNDLRMSVYRIENHLHEQYGFGNITWGLIEKIMEVLNNLIKESEEEE
ncbi:hypothetical protein FACS189472_15950 [Alphaproteobacteria bacterium]|nr:hypothetical protein FACS189472_15950 [Alphaproteobacteria bacterium]